MTTSTARSTFERVLRQLALVQLRLGHSPEAIAGALCQVAVDVLDHTNHDAEEIADWLHAQGRNVHQPKLQ